MIDLDKYCEKEDSIRLYLTKPFRQKEGLIATNGHILVCIPDDGRELISTGIPPVPEKTTVRISGWLAEQHTFVPFYKSLVPTTKCPQCEGSGQRLVIEEDETENMERCESCDGEGLAVEIGHSVVAMRYANMLNEFTNVKLTHRLPNDMIHFVFDGGRGCVMPMKVV